MVLEALDQANVVRGVSKDPDAESGAISVRKPFDAT